MLKRLLAAIEQAKREGRPLARIQVRNSDLTELESELFDGGATFIAGAAVALPDGARVSIAGVPVFPGPSEKAHVELDCLRAVAVAVERWANEDAGDAQLTPADEYLLDAAIAAGIIEPPPP